MRKVRVFIAMSLDGYIADAKGGIAWLQGEKEGEDDMRSYPAFIADVDTILMGWKTYAQIKEELSSDVWYYHEHTTYVLTHRRQTDSDEIFFIDEDTTALVKRLRDMEGKDIWVCGGSNIIAPLVKENIIDQYHISILPILLGDGIPLFPASPACLTLHLIHTASYNGIVDVVYERRSDH